MKLTKNQMTVLNLYLKGEDEVHSMDLDYPREMKFLEINKLIFNPMIIDDQSDMEFYLHNITRKS